MVFRADFEVAAMAQSLTNATPVSAYMPVRVADVGDAISRVCPPANTTQKDYNVVALSPSYASDLTVIIGRFETLSISTDGGKTWSKRALLRTPVAPSMPCLLEDPVSGGCFFRGPGSDDVGSGVVNSVVFSTAYATDQTIFVSGKDLGVQVSYDAGATFDHTLDLAGTVLSLAMSPSFDADGVLIAQTGDQQVAGNFVELSHATELFLSANRGQSWDTLPQPRPGLWDLVSISPNFALDKTLVSAFCASRWDLDQKQILVSIDAGQSWSGVPQRVGGVGLVFSNGLSLAPTFATSGEFVVGLLGAGAGVVAGSINTTSLRLQQITRSGRAVGTGEVLDVSGRPFGWGVVTNVMRTLGTPLAYSPRYASDDMVLGVSYRSLIKSTDKGRTWHTLQSLPNTDPACGTPQCLRCHIPAVKYAGMCVQCKPGYSITPTGTCAWDGAACSSHSRQNCSEAAMRRGTRYHPGLKAVRVASQLGNFLSCPSAICKH